MEGTLLKKLGLSYQKIASAIGSSKTQVHGVLTGDRSDPFLEGRINTLLREKGALPQDIDELFYFGGSKMLKQLIEKDVFTSSLNEKKEVFESESFQIALSVMNEAIKLRKFVAIVGETGSGKTNMVRYLEDLTVTDDSIIISNIHNHDFDRVRIRNIYEAILYDIQPGASPKSSTEALIRQVKQILTSLHKEGKRIVLVVDEAHHVHHKTLLALKDAWDSTYGFSRLLGIILLGQEDLVTKLEETVVKEVNSRIERITLRSINTPEECRSYISHLCELREIDLNGIITDKAFQEIASRRGSFLGINQITKQAVSVAIRAGSESLTDKHFRNI